MRRTLRICSPNGTRAMLNDPASSVRVGRPSVRLTSAPINGRDVLTSRTTPVIVTDDCAPRTNNGATTRAAPARNIDLNVMPLLQLAHPDVAEADGRARVAVRLEKDRCGA